jgi:hypothetical protein
MTEAEARVLLRDCGGFGGIEAWIAGQRGRLQSARLLNGAWRWPAPSRRQAF